MSGVLTAGVKAKAARFPIERCHFHGNNKGETELREAVEAGVT